MTVNSVKIVIMKKKKFKSPSMIKCRITKKRQTIVTNIKQNQMVKCNGTFSDFIDLVASKVQVYEMLKTTETKIRSIAQTLY